jgi:hypothetical protein
MMSVEIENTGVKYWWSYDRFRFLGNRHTTDSRNHRPFGLTFCLSGQIESGIFFQFGIVSFTATSCTSGLPVGYTEVFPFLNWIKENLKK